MHTVGLKYWNYLDYDENVVSVGDIVRVWDDKRMSLAVVKKISRREDIRNYHAEDIPKIAVTFVREDNGKTETRSAGGLKRDTPNVVLLDVALPLRVAS